MSNNEERLVGLNEAAARLGVCKRTVQRLISSGELPWPVKLGSRSLLLESDIQDYLQKLIKTRRKVVTS